MWPRKVDIFFLSLLFPLFAGPNVLNLAGLKFKFVGEREKGHDRLENSLSEDVHALAVALERSKSSKEPGSVPS